jgi:hypothetical protein
MRLSGSKAALMQPLIRCGAVKMEVRGSSLACHTCFRADFPSRELRQTNDVDYKVRSN